ncbi:MAG: hypothetical protein JXQ72_10530, partial [Anaerolineae bacterium]|nr:hypothetical protein [Anaerolineae bacterium]
MKWLRALWVIALVAGSIAVRGSSAVAGPARQGGTPLVFGEAVTGTLNENMFRQVYVFSGQADDIITVSMERIEG